MKIAIAQTIAHSDFEKNFETFQAFTQKAKALGAELIVFPEMAYFSAKKKDWMALAPQYPKLIEQFQGLAKSVGLAILPGTLREPTKNPEKFYNTLCLIDSSGKVISVHSTLDILSSSQRNII